MMRRKRTTTQLLFLYDRHTAEVTSTIETLLFFYPGCNVPSVPVFIEKKSTLTIALFQCHDAADSDGKGSSIRNCVA